MYIGPVHKNVFFLHISTLETPSLKEKKCEKNHKMVTQNKPAKVEIMKMRFYQHTYQS